MKGAMRVLVLALGALLTLSANAQERTIQRIINNAGERCDRVVNLRAGAAINNGDVLVIADCSDGSSHLVRLDVRDRFSYYMPCRSIAAPVRC